MLPSPVNFDAGEGKLFTMELWLDGSDGYRLKEIAMSQLQINGEFCRTCLSLLSMRVSETQNVI